jgi:hypothetical protein
VRRPLGLTPGGRTSGGWPRLGWPTTIAVVVLLLAVSFATQWHMGAYAAELGYDEGSHYASGLMIHDYLLGMLLHGPGTSPMRFLIGWHSHYPLVGIGHWGPLYYAVEAVWMLLAGTSRAAALVLSAVVAAATGALVCVVAARQGGRVLGVLAGLAFVISPIVQQGSAAVMLDLPIALLCLSAALTYAAWLREGWWGWALGFALLAGAALLVKGNGACLALLPPFVVLIGWRWDLLRRWSFWLPVPVVGVLAGPWYAITYGQVEAGFRYGWGWAYTSDALRENALILLGGAGPALLAAGVVGFVAACTRQPRANATVICMAALLAAVCVFQTVVPAAIQDRYLAPTLPPLLILAAWAVTRLLRWSVWRDVAMAVLVLALLPGAADMAPKQRFGMLQAAAQVWANRLPANPAVLVVSDGAAEGAAVAALAERDPARPSLFAVRGSRLLGGGGYNRADYLPRYTTPQEVMAAIDAYAIPLVILRTSDGGDEWAHVGQVAEAARLFPDQWELIWHDDGPGFQVRLFRIKDNARRIAEFARLLELNAPQHLVGQP